MTPITRSRAPQSDAFAQGARDIVPMAIGVAPFGVAIGAAIGASPIPIVVGWLGGPLILAGSAQLTALQMLDTGAAPIVIVVSALMLNARILMYGAALAPSFRDETLVQRLLLALPLIDQLYLVCAPRFEAGDLDRSERKSYYVGGATLLVGTWVGSQTFGLIAGVGLPASIGLHLAAPLALAGLLAKSLATRPATVAASVAAFAAVAGAGLPFQASVLVAALAGVASGTASANSTARLDRRKVAV